MQANQESRLQGAVTGWHQPIVGTLLSVTGTPTTLAISGPNNNNVGSFSLLAGATLGAGTFYFSIPTSGCSAVDVVLRTSSGGTNITAASTKLYPALYDGVTEKMNAAGTSQAVAAAAFVDATQQTISFTSLRGERGCILKIVTTGSVTFDQAEITAL